MALWANQLFLSPGWMLTGPSFPETGVWTMKPPRWDLILKKKVSWVCFILIKETETQKTSLPVPEANTDKTTSELPQRDLQTWKAC